MVVIFNLKNSRLLPLSLPTEEVFQVNGQNRPVANLPVVDFHSQPREMLTPKPLNTQLSVFLLVYFSILVFFPSQQSLNLIVCQRYGFFSVLAVIIRESSDKNSLFKLISLFLKHRTPNLYVVAMAKFSGSISPHHLLHTKNTPLGSGMWWSY